MLSLASSALHHFRQTGSIVVRLWSYAGSQSSLCFISFGLWAQSCARVPISAHREHTMLPAAKRGNKGAVTGTIEAHSIPHPPESSRIGIIGLMIARPQSQTPRVWKGGEGRRRRKERRDD